MFFYRQIESDEIHFDIVICKVSHEYNLKNGGIQNNNPPVL
jgi:hypothetical protein